MRREHLVTILIPVTRTYWSVLGIIRISAIFIPFPTPRSVPTSLGWEGYGRYDCYRLYLLSYWKPCSFIFMYFHTSKFYIRLKDEKKDIKKLKYYVLTKAKKFIKYLVMVNCINRSEKGIWLFKFPADICRQLVILYYIYAIAVK